MILGLDPFTNVVPFIPPQEESLRDKMLKQGDSDFNQPEKKMDIDLDGKLVRNFIKN